jgi:hypothetical protein
MKTENEIRLETELAIRIRLGFIVKEDYVETWLHTHNPAFDNKKPIELIWENNIDPLYKMIVAIEGDTLP